jgi:D-threonate/D-erythronate kinase
MVGILADDLAGAAELAGVAWRHGLSAEVHTLSTCAANAEAVAIDTDSRHCDAVEATRRVTEAAQHLKSLGAEWIYKKVDSLLRGPVSAEVEAALSALQLNRALLVPVNPGRDRVIRDGTYFIDGTPIHETAFRNDPQHPRTSSRVLEMLGPARSRPIDVCRPDQAMPRAGIVVGEGATTADLQAWAGQLDPGILPSGAAEFFSAILDRKRFAHNQSQFVDSMSGQGPTLFVCGSLAASALDFVDGCRQRGLPVVPMPSSLSQKTKSPNALVQLWAKEVIGGFARRSQVVITIGRPAVTEDEGRLTGLLVATVKAVVSQVTAAEINAEGGATAAALSRVMGWDRLRVIREISPGVVMMRAGEHSRIAFTVKPGSYKWPAALVG